MLASTIHKPYLLMKLGAVCPKLPRKLLLRQHGMWYITLNLSTAYANIPAVAAVDAQIRLESRLLVVSLVFFLFIINLEVSQLI